jgi:hypothetical protein
MDSLLAKLKLVASANIKPTDLCCGTAQTIAKTKYLLLKVRRCRCCNLCNCFPLGQKSQWASSSTQNDRREKKKYKWI